MNDWQKSRLSWLPFVLGGFVVGLLIPLPHQKHKLIHVPGEIEQHGYSNIVIRMEKSGRIYEADFRNGTNKDLIQIGTRIP